jgi:hypothetical protein
VISIGEFKEVHKAADKVQSSGARPADLKAEITQLEQERTQLENKIRRMKKEAQNDDNFDDMLKVNFFLPLQINSTTYPYHSLPLYMLCLSVYLSISVCGKMS